MYKDKAWLLARIAKATFCSGCARARCQARYRSAGNRQIIGCFEGGYVYSNGWLYAHDCGIVKPAQPETEVYVLDTSALFVGIPLPQGLPCHLPPSALEELRRKGVAAELALYPNITVQQPSLVAVRYIREVAESTGDIAKLSPVDIDVLALAYELDAQLWSDDYAVQNIAAVLGIKYQPLAEEGIRAIFHYKYRCTGCGRKFREFCEVCETCGAPVKPYPVRSTRVR